MSGQLAEEGAVRSVRTSKQPFMGSHLFGRQRGNEKALLKMCTAILGLSPGVALLSHSQTGLNGNSEMMQQKLVNAANVLQ